MQVVESEENLDENVHDEFLGKGVGIERTLLNLIRPLLDVETQVTN